MRHLFTLVLLGLVCNVSAQLDMDMKVGEPFPYQGYFSISGENGTVRNVSSYKGKNLLLVLFGSHCILNFRDLPQLNGYQEEYRERLQILLIGNEDANLRNTFQRYQDKYNLKLKVAFDSTFFPHLKFFFLPTYVWLAPDGTIQAVSAPDQVNHQNLKTFVSRRPLPFGALPQRAKFDYRKNYLDDGNGSADSNYLLRTVFGKWDPSIVLASPERLNYDTQTRRFQALGATTEDLYKYQFFGTRYWDDTDPLNGKVWPHVMIDGDSSIKLNDRYCFAVSSHTSDTPVLRTVLKNTLDQQFGYQARVEKREMPYLRICLDTTKAFLLKTKGGRSYAKRTHDRLELSNKKLAQLIWYMGYYNNTGLPLVDETDTDFSIDIKLDCILTDSEDFTMALKEKGILIEKKMKVMEVLLISRKKGVTAR